ISPPAFRETVRPTPLKLFGGLRTRDHANIEKSRYVRNRLAKHGHFSRPPRASQSRPPSPKFPCSPPPDPCPRQSQLARDASPRCQRSRPTPCRYSPERRSRATHLRPKKSEACTRVLLAGCRSLFHRPGKPTPVGPGSPPPPVFPRFCSPPDQQFPFVPGCRAQL